MPNLNEAPREVTSTAVQKSYGVHRKTHPMLIVAAGAVTVFAAVGVGVMTGVIPSAHSVNSANSANSAKAESSMPLVPTPMTASAVMGSAGAASDAAVPDAVARDANVKSAADLKPVDNQSIGQPLAKPVQNVAPQASSAPAKSTATTRAPANKTTVAQASPSPRSSSSSQGGAPTPVYAQNSQAPQGTPSSATEAPRGSVSAPEPAICRTCGTVESVNAVAKKGEGSGAGAVLGGVLGGVLGHQVGNGRGKDLATVAGAVGGAVLGNNVEKNAKSSSSFNVRVRMEDNTFQTIPFEAEPSYRIGDKVRVENGRIVRG